MEDSDSLDIDQNIAMLKGGTVEKQDLEMPKARRRPSNIEAISEHLNERKFVSKFESALNNQSAEKRVPSKKQQKHMQAPRVDTQQT